MNTSEEERGMPVRAARFLGYGHNILAAASAAVIMSSSASAVVPCFRGASRQFIHLKAKAELVIPF